MPRGQPRSLCFKHEISKAIDDWAVRMKLPRQRTVGVAANHCVGAHINQKATSAHHLWTRIGIELKPAMKKHDEDTTLLVQSNGLHTPDDDRADSPLACARRQWNTPARPSNRPQSSGRQCEQRNGALSLLNVLTSANDTQSRPSNRPYGLLQAGGAVVKTVIVGQIQELPFGSRESADTSDCGASVLFPLCRLVSVVKPTDTRDSRSKGGRWRFRPTNRGRLRARCLRRTNSSTLPIGHTSPPMTIRTIVPVYRASGADMGERQSRPPDPCVRPEEEERGQTAEPESVRPGDWFFPC